MKITVEITHGYFIKQLKRAAGTDFIYICLVMSSAFVREGDEQWLHDITPTLPALIQYLTRENNGILVSERSRYYDKKVEQEVIVMSNGLGYAKDKDGKWMVV